MSIYDNTYSPPQVVSFNSKDRVSGTNSSFQSVPVDLGQNRYDSVCLVQASIPKSFYNVPTNYNQFVLKELGLSTTITVPVGSYNKNNLMTTLSTLLTAGSVALGHTWVYTVSYSATTGPDTFKYTYTVTGNTGQPSLIFTDESPFRQLGFEPSSTNIFVANTISSTNAINLSYILRMFIKSNISQNAQDGILEEILSVGSFPPLSIVFYQQYNFDMNTKTFNTDNKNSWLFSLVDSYGQEIDLNGIPWAFTLVFYQRNTTHEIHKADLLINNEQRLFNIQQQQNEIQKQLGAENNGINPVYTVKPFGSSSVVDAFLPPEIVYPK